MGPNMFDIQPEVYLSGQYLFKRIVCIEGSANPFSDSIGVPFQDHFLRGVVYCRREINLEIRDNQTGILIGYLCASIIPSGKYSYKAEVTRVTFLTVTPEWTGPDIGKLNLNPLYFLTPTSSNDTLSSWGINEMPLSGGLTPEGYKFIQTGKVRPNASFPRYYDRPIWYLVEPGGVFPIEKPMMITLISNGRHLLVPPEWDESYTETFLNILWQT